MNFWKSQMTGLSMGALVAASVFMGYQINGDAIEKECPAVKSEMSYCSFATEDDFQFSFKTCEIKDWD